MRPTKGLIAGVLLSAAATIAGTFVVRLGPASVYAGAGIVIVAGVAFIIFGILALVAGFRTASANASAFRGMGSASNLRLAASLAVTFLLCNALVLLLIRPASPRTLITVNIVVPFAWVFARYFSFRVLEHRK